MNQKSQAIKPDDAVGGGAIKHEFAGRSRGHRARDLMIVLASAGLFALLASGFYAARVIERELPGTHGPIGLIALGPVLLVYSAGAVALAVLWQRNRRAMRRSVALVAITPTVVLVVLALLVCWLIAAPGG